MCPENHQSCSIAAQSNEDCKTVKVKATCIDDKGETTHSEYSLPNKNEDCNIILATTFSGTSVPKSHNRHN